MKGWAVSNGMHKHRKGATRGAMPRAELPVTRSLTGTPTGEGPGDALDILSMSLALRLQGLDALLHDLDTRLHRLESRIDCEESFPCICGDVFDCSKVDKLAT